MVPLACRSASSSSCNNSSGSSGSTASLISKPIFSAADSKGKITSVSILVAVSRSCSWLACCGAPLAVLTVTFRVAELLPSLSSSTRAP